MAELDYRTHVLRLEGPLALTDDAAGDMAKVLSYYDEADGKFPERFVRPDW